MLVVAADPVIIEHQMDEFYILDAQQQQSGPFTLSQLQGMWRVSNVTAKTLYWQQGFDEWIPLSTMSEALEPPRTATPHFRVATAQPHSSNPPSFGTIVFFTILLPIVGLVAGIIWLCNPRHRGAGGAIIAIAFTLMFIYSLVLNQLFR